MENSSSKLIILDSPHDALIEINSSSALVPVNSNSDLVSINSMSFSSNSLYSQTTSITHVSSDLQERLASLEITLDNIQDLLINRKNKKTRIPRRIILTSKSVSPVLRSIFKKLTNQLKESEKLLNNLKTQLNSIYYEEEQEKKKRLKKKTQNTFHLWIIQKNFEKLNSSQLLKTQRKKFGYSYWIINTSMRILI